MKEVLYTMYFETVEEAEQYAKEHKIEKYHFETPSYVETGVDMVWFRSDENIDEYIKSLANKIK